MAAPDVGHVHAPRLPVCLTAFPSSIVGSVILLPSIDQSKRRKQPARAVLHCVCVAFVLCCVCVAFVLRLCCVCVAGTVHCFMVSISARMLLEEAQKKKKTEGGWA